jgi:transglutaminase-like putative cysteine protease
MRDVMRGPVLALALALLGAAHIAGASEPLYRFAPVPSWVQAITPDYAAPLPAGGVADGAWDLLLDRQTRVNPDGQDFYQHSATRITNASGLDQQTQLDIEVDPSFQTLTLHSLKVVRQGRVIDQKPVARITALPQETELREKIYNGTYNINVLLSDVRVGDVVEYDYTSHSVERIFPGVFSERMPVAWAVPVLRQRVRVLAPENLPLFFRTGDGSTPTVAVRAGVRELEWQWHDLAAITGDSDRPKWYSTWPNLEISSVRNWSEAAQRIAPLYEVHPVRNAALAQVVAEIRRSGGTPAEQALHALQFVQEQIRYVSISIGPGGFRPTPPQITLERRFGDCKDKSLLLATLLNELGGHAQVALVNTRQGKVLVSYLPTPYAFNHAIVRLQLDTQVYWLDGTADKQYSPLSTAAPADFERALVADPAVTELESIPRPALGASTKASEISVDLRAGYDKPAKLQISTFYRGKLADQTRQKLADETPAERQSNYINYIVGYYPGAKTAAPIETLDDVVKNVLEVRESYTLEHPFKRNHNGRWELFLQADEIYRFTDELKSSVRKAPLRIAYPIDVRQTVRALLPESKSINNETVRVDNPAFHYESVVSYSDTGGVPLLTLDYHYQSLADFVEVAELPKYQQDRTRAYDDTGYYVRSSATSTTSTIFTVQRRQPVGTTAWVPRLFELAAGVFMVVACYFVGRWNPPPMPSELNWPVGIRGWLWVAVLSVTVWPLVTIGRHTMEVMSLLDVKHWERLQSTVPAPWREWAAPILLVIMVCGVFLFVMQLLLLFLFFRRRTSVPYLFIFLSWMSVFYNGVVWAVPVSFQLHSEWNEPRVIFGLLGMVAFAGLFTMYFLSSKRVKATFVRRRAERGWEAAVLTSPART